MALHIIITIAMADIIVGVSDFRSGLGITGLTIAFILITRTHFILHIMIITTVMGVLITEMYI